MSKAYSQDGAVNKVSKEVGAVVLSRPPTNSKYLASDDAGFKLARIRVAVETKGRNVHAHTWVSDCMKT